MPIITITGGIGCDVESVAELVAGQLDLPLFNDTKLLEEAEKMGLSEKVSMESLKEKAHSVLNLLSTKPKEYLDLMEAVIFEAARKGNGVILGHAGQMLLRGFDGVLHVRIFASEENRCRNLSEKQSMDREAARKIIHKSDNEKRGFLHTAFHADWDDLSLYDIVVNMERLDSKAAAGLIAGAANTEKIKTGMGNMEERLEKKALVKIVEAALLKNVYANRLIIEAVEKDVVKITGFVDCQRDADDMVKTVENLPGVSRVVSEIAIFPIVGGY